MRPFASGLEQWVSRLVSWDLSGVVGEESVLEDVHFAIYCFDEDIISVAEQREGVDLVAFVDLGKGPDVFGILGMV